MQDDTQTTNHTQPEAGPVQIRRNAALTATIAVVAGVLAVGFGTRAFGGGGLLDWVGLAVLGVVALLHGTALVDSRAPLLVADSHGVRIREGARWQGISWPEVDCLEHLPRRGPFRDGHLLVVGYDDQQLIVPLSVATRVVGSSSSTLSDDLADLADGRTDVVEVVPGLADEDADPPPPPIEREDTTPIVRRDIAAAVEENYRASSGTEQVKGPDDIATGEMSAVQVAPRLSLRPKAWASQVAGANALQVDEQLDEEVTVVLADVSVQPAEAPVIGPTLRAARERLGLRIDQLAERTRIRPHVIEAIEVDDFAPCGGDFYARGHLRTLGRVLGVDPTGLVATYDADYAEAPIDARRVFQAELASATGGSVHGTRGGRNWSVLIAAVMAAVLVWSVAQLLMGSPVKVDAPPALNQSGGLPKPAAAADPISLSLTAVGGGAEVVVRDGSGDVVFDGTLAFQQSLDLELAPPARIWTSDGSVTASINGADPEPLGDTGAEATTTLVDRD